MLSRRTKIYVAGHRGMVGAAVVHALQARNFENILTRSHQEIDLTDQAATRHFFATEEPQIAIIAAARVGGIHANDAANGILHLLELEAPPDWVNLGCGTDILIGDLAWLVKEVVGFEGNLTFDTSKPDGVSRRLTDNSRMKATGWAPKIPLEEGVALAYRSFLEEQRGGFLRT